MVRFLGQVPKDPNYPEEIEDALQIDTITARAAISDGASESFDSKTWAQLLVKAFLRSPGLNSKWLSDVVRHYNGRYDLSTLSWSKCAAFERGSFASLLGVEESSAHKDIEILSVGDSLAVLLVGVNFVDSFPYKNFLQFQNRPELFCTNPAHNGFLSAPDFFSRHQRTWSLDSVEKPRLLCMTDALGEWALKMAHEGNPQWETLSSITDMSQLEKIVIREREQRRMRVDDVTLVSLTFGE